MVCQSSQRKHLQQYIAEAANSVLQSCTRITWRALNALGKRKFNLKVSCFKYVCEYMYTYIYMNG